MWLVGVVSEVGVASGWNLWVVVTMYRCGYSVVIRRYIDILIIIINFPYSTCIRPGTLKMWSWIFLLHTNIKII